MACCALCHNLEKRDVDDLRLAFDFIPSELQRSAHDHGCQSCLVIYKGLRQAETLYSGEFHKDVKIVYARCRGERGDHRDSLTLEVYFIDERPKFKLEFYSLHPDGMSECAGGAVSDY
jgi:hypothetical protein